MIKFDEGPDRASITELDQKESGLPSKKLVMLSAHA
jgi:hypothetical protein